MQPNFFTMFTEKSLSFFQFITEMRMNFTFSRFKMKKSTHLVIDLQRILDVYYYASVVEEYLILNLEMDYTVLS